MRIAIGALALGIIAVRVAGLGQFPQLHPDEGFWSGGARNWALYGDALMDGRLHPFLSPGHFVVLSGYFLLAPPNLVSARLFAAATGLLTCALIGWLSRRCFPGRSWLWLALFGFSSLAVLIQRTALLESHQTFWLVLAAVFWLSESKAAALGAGAAAGMALLVKSNSIYLLPVFLLTLPRPVEGNEKSTQRIRVWSTVQFVSACALVGGGGYLIAWLCNPDGFAAAFRFELEGQHFVNEGVLLHVGRFGLHPHRVGTALGQLLYTDPFLLPLALGALVMFLRQPQGMTRADRFFSGWTVIGFVFIFGQIYVTHRYLTTLTPAIAYLAARALDRLLSWSAAKFSERWFRSAIVGMLVLFCGFHATRVTAGIWRCPNATYWQTVTWITAVHGSSEANVLAAPSIGLSLPLRSFDYYRLIYHYDGTEDRLAAVVERHRISFLIVDGEWREHQNADMAQFVAEQCTLQASFGEASETGHMDFYRVNPAKSR
jgi:hypothetical protein